ncbi:hypothetical protein SO694_0008507 [Aureococcus anophagefferens]|uniref:GATA-type domain-containing protein n=1 Tax=Aureococcus anophagefferens TaxID=44056 RepID=A0ABR1G404_AURAN
MEKPDEASATRCNTDPYWDALGAVSCVGFVAAMSASAGGWDMPGPQQMTRGDCDRLNATEPRFKAVCLRGGTEPPRSGKYDIAGPPAARRAALLLGGEHTAPAAALKRRRSKSGDAPSFASGAKHPPGAARPPKPRRRSQRRRRAGGAGREREASVVVDVGCLPQLATIPVLPVPQYEALINFNRTKGARAAHHCVARGRGPRAAKPGDPPPAKPDVVIIPTQNKDVCKICDTVTWKHAPTQAYFKWCKGCKRFHAIHAFAGKLKASKCDESRARGRAGYMRRKDAPGARTAPGAPPQQPAAPFGDPSVGAPPQPPPPPMAPAPDANPSPSRRS